MFISRRFDSDHEFSSSILYLRARSLSSLASVAPREAAQTPPADNSPPSPTIRIIVAVVIIVSILLLVLLTTTIIILSRRRRIPSQKTAIPILRHRKDAPSDASSSSFGSHSVLHGIDVSETSRPAIMLLAFPRRTHQAASSVSSSILSTKDKSPSLIAEDLLEEGYGEETLDISATSYFAKRPTGIDLQEIQISDAQVDPRRNVLASGNEAKGEGGIVVPSKALLKHFRSAA